MRSSRARDSKNHKFRGFQENGKCAHARNENPLSRKSRKINSDRLVKRFVDSASASMGREMLKRHTFLDGKVWFGMELLCPEFLLSAKCSEYTLFHPKMCILSITRPTEALAESTKRFTCRPRLNFLDFWVSGFSFLACVEIQGISITVQILCFLKES